MSAMPSDRGYGASGRGRAAHRSVAGSVMARVADDIVVSAVVRDGRLRIRNRRLFDQQVAQLREGTEWELTLQRRRATRSVAANAYYWGVVLELLREHTGYTVDELHDLCKAQFLPKRLAINNGNGEVVGEYVLGGSTRKLTTTEFYEYVERIRKWAAYLDCNIPDPNEGAL